jgi:hypothetical protein
MSIHLDWWQSSIVDGYPEITVLDRADIPDHLVTDGLLLPRIPFRSKQSVALLLPAPSLPIKPRLKPILWVFR